MEEKELDCKGLRCPMPIVKIGKEIKNLEVGEVLKVEATDPAFQIDIEAWARQTNNLIVSFEDGEVKKVSIKKQ